MPSDEFPMPSSTTLPAGAPWSGVGGDPLRDAAIGGEEFADLVSMAARVLGAPVALLSAGHGTGSRLVAHHGLDGADFGSSALLHALGAECRPLQLSDARADPLHRDDPLVAGAPHIRFFLASNIRGPAGSSLGSLAIADTRPRGPLSAADEQALAQLCRMAARLFERHQLLRRNRIAAQIIQAGFSAVIVLDDEHRVAFANRRAEALFGTRARAMRGMPLSVLFPPHLQPDPAAADAWLQAPSPAAGERFHLHTRDEYGQARTLDATRCVWRLSQGQGLALVMRDITEQLAQQESLRRIALVDSLTGLPNRNALVNLIGAKAAGSSTLGLALLSLDNFQGINDTLGHGTGDGVLCAAADRLRAALPEDSTLARFGGDDFAVVYPHADIDTLGPQLDRLLEQVAQPYDVDGHVILLDPSIGLALLGDQDGEHRAPSHLIACADLALYKAKAAGGRRWCRFDPAMRREMIDRRMLDLELRRAYAQGEFELHYQPQIDLGSGRTFGAEALLRWRHPQRGLLSPALFIEALAASPVAADVGRWIIQQACLDATRWPRIDGREVAISVNLFPVQVTDSRLQAEVDRALAATGLSAERLELEITETIALRPDDNAARALASLRERGVRLAFDDFGTGYASLSMLQRFPVDRVKIDRSFVRDMLDNHGDAAIVRSIMLISRNLELQVIAEGVEKRDQADLLRGLGCQGAQGFLYAPALTPAQFDRWLAAQAASPGAPPWQRPEACGHA
jgi:diguanylate cyclase (GGDEF)-like protein/PAS domain S-box-containing protein